MAESAPRHARSLVARPDQPLIGVILEEDGREVVRYFVDEDEADSAMSHTAAQAALSVIGAWSDLDWDEAVEMLERIRHETPPTPPISL